MIGLVFAIGFTQGVTPVIGQHFGKGDGRAVASALCNSAVLNTVMAVVLTGIMLTVGAFMDRMGQDPEVLAHAKDYYFIIVAGFIPMIAFFNVRFFSEGIGNTRNEMWITIGTNLINIFLNWVSSTATSERRDSEWPARPGPHSSPEYWEPLPFSSSCSEWRNTVNSSASPRAGPYICRRYTAS